MNMDKQVVIFGTSELSQLAHFYFTHDSTYTVAAFTLDQNYIKTDNFMGLPVVPFDQVEQHYPADQFFMYIAVGYSNLNESRKTKYYQAKEKGYRLATYISSKSTSWLGLEVGDNTFIMENNSIMPFCKIGSNVLICVNNILAHHMVVNDHVTITSHCAIGGYVNIRESAFIGLNATLRDRITIGRSAIVGASANVVKDVNDYAVMLGNPARSTGDDSRNISL